MKTQLLLCISGIAIIFGFNTAKATLTRVKLFTPGDASLKTLSVSTGTSLIRKPGALPNVNYSTSVPVGTSSITFTPVANDPGQTIKYLGNLVASGTSSVSIPLTSTAGATTTFSFTVQSQDGTLIYTYNISVTENGSNNAILSNLAVSNGTTLVKTSTNGTTVNYTTTVPAGTNSVLVTPVAQDANAVIKVMGTTVTSGTASGNIPVSNGSVVTTIVTAQDGVTTETYNVTVNYATGDATLKTISLSTNTSLIPAGTGPANVNYTTDVSPGTSSIKVTPVVSIATTTVTVNGVTVASGSASNPITLNATGTTVITLVGTAADGVTTKSYSITVSKNGSNNAGLSTLSVSNGSALVRTPGSTSPINYTTTVSTGITSVTVTPTASDPNATITVNGTTVASGSPSQSIALTSPTTTINLQVTAQDGTPQSYSITVTIGNSNDATLSTLSLNPASTLTQVSGPSNVNYNASVSPGTTTVTLTPTASNSHATITYNGAIVASGSATLPITLTGATTAITLTVTAQDGVTVKTYTVNVSKAGSSDASLKSIALNPASTLTLVPNGPGNTNYTTAVSQSLASVTVIPVTTDPNATVTVDYKTVASGAQSQAINLTPGGSTFITVQVTAQNGTTVSTYSIHVTRIGQNTFTWTGGGPNSNWTTAANWSPMGVPGANDEAMVGSTNNNPVIDAPSTVSALTITGATTITLTAPLTATASTDLNAPLTLTGAAVYNGNALTTAPNGAGAAFGLTTATGTNTNFTTINLSTNTNLSNSGLLTANSTIYIDYKSGISNQGTFNASNGNITLVGNGFISNLTGGIFNISNSPSINVNYSAIGNTGTMIIGKSNINMGNSGTIINGSNSPNTPNTPTSTLTINGGSTIDFATNAGVNAYINNIDGIFNAGTTDSPVVINLNYSGANIQNTGSFTLANSSIINMPSDNTHISNTGTFTFASNKTSSATLGQVLGNSAKCDGIYNVQRYMSGSFTDNSYRNYRLLSSPVYAAKNIAGTPIYSLNYAANGSPTAGSGGIPGGFDQTGNPTIYLYREDVAISNSGFSTGNFKGLATINNSPNYTVEGYQDTIFNVPVGNGFQFFYRGSKSNLSAKFTPGAIADPSLYNQIGYLNVGSVTVTQWFTKGSANIDYNTVSGTSAGFALVGNPYASSIDLNTISATDPSAGIFAPHISQFIYELNPTSKNYDTYSSTTGSTSPTATNIIVSGQGFYIQALDASASLTFNEKAKTNAQNSGPTLYLGKPNQNAVNQLLYLKLSKDNENFDQTTISFKDNNKQQYVLNEDAPYKTGEGLVSLSSLSADGVALAVNGLSLPKNSLTVPLNVSATNDGTYQLNMAAIKSIPELYDVWLMDSYKKDSVDMRHTPTYSFNISKGDPDSYGVNRFSLVIRQNPALGLQLINFTATKATIGAQVVWKTVNEANYTNFTVERSTDNGVNFEVLGGYLSSSLGTYSYTDNTALKGVNQYRLKLEDLNGNITYSNVVTLMISPNLNGLAGNINIYPNPSTGVINLTVNSGITSFASLSSIKTVGTSSALAVSANTGASPSYSIKIVNVTGAVVKTATSSSPTWQDNVSGLLPGTYFIQVTNKSDNSLVGKSSFVKL